MSNITLVANEVYRSPRPEPADFATIKAQFKTVISLEGLDEDRKEQTELAPVKFFSQPISFWQIYFSGITQNYLAGIQSIIEYCEKPALVHCQHGQDRTGLIIAVYRMKACGWDEEDAMAEALRYGYRDWLNFGLNKTWNEFCNGITQG